MESSYSDTDNEKFVDEPYSKIDDYSPVKTKELLQQQLEIEIDNISKTFRSRTKKTDTPIKKIRRNLFRSVDVWSVGDLNKLDLKNIRMLNPTAAKQEKLIKLKDLQLLKKRKEYRIINQQYLLKSIQKKENKMLKQLYKKLSML